MIRAMASLPAIPPLSRRHWLRWLTVGALTLADSAEAARRRGGKKMPPKGKFKGKSKGKPAKAAPAAAAQALLLLPPLPIRERRLANGLQQVSVVNPASAAVSVQVWYRVGGKDDPAGRSGFAHLFEHLMFKGTKTTAPESFDRLTEDVGGQNNAFTAEDMTVYQSEVPSNHLERLLWAEADRLAYLTVDDKNLASERLVVIEELRQRILADPYGRLFDSFAEYGYSQHPYRRSVIGNQADLEAATLTDVRAFHSTYYRPDNAVLVVAGDFDPAQLDTWIDRYFAPLARPATPIPRVTVTEPPRAADRRVVLNAPQVPLPALALLWQGPPANHPDSPALEVAAALLSAGESSRLNEALVYRSQIAQSVGFSADLHADAGQLVAYAIAASARSLRLLEAALFTELQRLGHKPITAAEMERVRARLLTGALLARQTPQGLANALGEAVVVYGDAHAADRRLARLQAVTAADVQRVLTQYVLRARRVSIDYQQGPAP